MLASRFLSLFGVFLGLCLGASLASARTWIVQEDGLGTAPGIQAGIDSAANGDTVQVMPGTYLENIDFRGKAIVVRGSGPQVTTIDGSGQDNSVARFAGGEPTAAVLEGLRITGGRGYSPSGTPGGGGILILEAEPTIRRNWVVSNRAVITLSGGSSNGHGGGIYCGSQNGIYRPVIEDNIIENNEAGLLGGGIRVHEESGPIIRRNIIRNNRAIRGDGGGICVAFSRADFVITENDISGNTAGDKGGGICIGTTAYADVSWNLISNNVSGGRDNAGYSGGGLAVATSGLVEIHNNTIVLNADNSAARATEGGAVAIGQGTVLLERNILALSPNGGGLHCRDGSGLRAADNLFWSNVPEDDISCGVVFSETSGNVIADPMFCNPEIDDYTLAKNSAALSHSAGPVGAFLIPGCEDVLVEPTTWSRVKARYGGP